MTSAIILPLLRAISAARLRPSTSTGSCLQAPDVAQASVFQWNGCFSFPGRGRTSFPTYLGERSVFSWRGAASGGTCPVLAWTTVHGVVLKDKFLLEIQGNVGCPPVPVQCCSSCFTRILHWAQRHCFQMGALAAFPHVLLERVLHDPQDHLLAVQDR